VSWDQLLAKLARLPLVVFEEIGVGREASDFRLDVLLEVLDQRANSPVRPFVVTSNLTPSQVEKVYDDRVSSRILAGTVFHLAGGDRRLARKPGG
jgi:DNA replication protein DnaC